VGNEQIPAGIQMFQDISLKMLAGAFTWEQITRPCVMATGR
jgi:hypothetical protein